MFGFVFFLAMYLAGNYLSSALSLPIPGAIVGLVLVLCILLIRGRVDAPVKEAADLFLKYLALMLVPIAVGVTQLVNVAPSDVWKLEIVVVLALIVGAIMTAKIMEGLLTLGKFQLRPVQQTKSAEPAE
jgi:holin-like protein